MAEMRPPEIPPEFWQHVQFHPPTGCWIWSGPTGGQSGYPVYSRRAAWKYAYEKLYGPIGNYGTYPTLDECEGPMFCVWPDHRMGLPRDRAMVRHECGLCGNWHDPEVDQ